MLYEWRDKTLIYANIRRNIWKYQKKILTFGLEQKIGFWEQTLRRIAKLCMEF